MVGISRDRRGTENFAATEVWKKCSWFLVGQEKKVYRFRLIDIRGRALDFLFT